MATESTYYWGDWSYCRLHDEERLRVGDLAYFPSGHPLWDGPVRPTVSVAADDGRVLIPPAELAPVTPG